MYLFMDVETTGKPKDYGGKMQDVDNWPRVAQLAWLLYDQNRTIISGKSAIIYPDGWKIPKEDFFIQNNMSTERCIKEGVPIYEVLEGLILSINQCEFLIAHNFNFDYNIIGAEMIRANLKADKKLKGVCTMESTTDFCKLPGKFKGKYKWPKLEELHEILFNQEIENAHDAMGDVETTAKCFFEFIDRGIIKL